ncbi:solute carrier family 35 member G1-like protein, partial [Dinothrombium tinctorium]
MNDIEKCESLKKKTIYEKISQIPAIGLLFALFQAFLTPTGSLIVKLVPELHPIELMIVASSFQLLAYFCIVLKEKNSLLPAKDERWIMLIRCVCGFVTASTWFTSIPYLPLGDASAIGLSAPIFVAIFARVILKESIGLTQAFSIVATIVGGFLILQPPFIFGIGEEINANHRIIGTSLAFLSVISSSMVCISLRKLQKTPVSVIIFLFSLFYVIVGPIALGITGNLRLPSEFKSYLLLFFFGMIGVCAQICLSLAFRLEQAGPVSLALSFGVVFAYVYQ